MGVSNDVPSIRIEPELPEGHGGRPHEIDPNRGPDFGRSAAIVAIGVIAALVVAFVVLRPETGRSADGSERQAPTTTVAEETSTTIEPVEEPQPLFAQFLDLDHSIREVVPAPIGYLGVLDTIAPRAEPPMVRSIDGVEWIEVDSQVIEPDDLDLVRSRFGAFIGLRTDETGFSVLRVRQLLSEPGRTDTGIFVIDRLLSEQGAQWTLDTAFTEITGRQAVALNSGGGDLVLSTTPPRPDFLERRTGRSQVAALSDLECSLRGSSLDRLFIDSCGEEGVEEISEPECSEAYLDSIESFDFAVVDSGTEGSYSGRGLLTSPEVIETGSIGPAVVALAGAISDQPANCVGTVLDSPERRPVGLAIWRENPNVPEVRHVPLDLANSEVDETELRDAVAIGPLGESLLVTTSDRLVRIWLDGTVEPFGSLTGVDLNVQVPKVFPTPNGLMLVDVRDGLLRIWDVDEDGVTAFEEPVFEQSGFGDVRFVDSNVVVVSSSSQDFAIQLPAVG